MINIKEIIQNTLILIFVFCLIVLLLALPILASHKLLLFSAFPVFFLSYILLRETEIRISFIPIDIGWLIFLVIGFLSYFWTINGALVWFPAFSYVGLVLWILIVRDLVIHETVQRFLPIVFLGLFGITTLHVLFIDITHGFKLAEPTTWNQNFGYNGNYMPTYLVCLYPFLLFSTIKTTFFNFLKLLGAIFITYIIYKTSTKGAVLAFFVLLIYYFKCVCPERYLKQLVSFSFLLSFLLFTCWYLNVASLLGVQMPENLVVKDASRFSMIQGSFSLFLKNPLLGIGLGNWHTEAYQHVDKLTGFNVRNFVRVSNHNLYSQHLSELGLLGFLGFYTPIFTVLWKGVRHNKQLNPLQKAALGSLLVYIVASIVYRDANIYEGHFSTIQLIAFCAIGILTQGAEKKSTSTIWIKSIFLIMSLACLSWFVYYLYTENIYKSADKLSVKSAQKFHLLSSIYHPIFKTTHGYRGYGGPNESLGLKLAALKEKQEQYAEAEQYFQEALKYAPNDEYLRMAYARFLLRKVNKPLEAKKHLLFVHLIQDDYLEANVLLTEISINEEKFKEARDYLNTFLFRLLKTAQFNYFEQVLYSSSYLSELVQLSNEQKNQLLPINSKIKRELNELKTKLIQIEIEEEKKNKADPKKILALKSEINQKIKDQRLEVQLIKTLNREQHLKYLEDKLYSLYKYYRWSPVLYFSNLLSLNEHQIEALVNLYLDVDVKLKDTRLRSKLPENQQQRRQYQMSIDSLKNAMDKGFMEIFTPEQYTIYKKERLEKELKPEFNKLQKKLKLEEARLSELKNIIINYEYDSFFLSKNTKQENLKSQLTKLRQSFCLSMDSILNKQQLKVVYEIIGEK